MSKNILQRMASAEILDKDKQCSVLSFRKARVFAAKKLNTNAKIIDARSLVLSQRQAALASMPCLLSLRYALNDAPASVNKIVARNLVGIETRDGRFEAKGILLPWGVHAMNNDGVDYSSIRAKLTKSRRETLSDKGRVFLHLSSYSI
jgi:hypothetical protein